MLLLGSESAACSTRFCPALLVREDRAPRFVPERGGVGYGRRFGSRAPATRCCESAAAHHRRTRMACGFCQGAHDWTFGTLFAAGNSVRQTSSF
jgi:hypothetical protein